MTAATAAERLRTFDGRRLFRRHGWTVGIFALLALFIVYWRSSTNLAWSPFDVQSLAIDALPFAFAAMAQAVVIISGGIDLSVGSMMSLINVVAAREMVHMSYREALLFALVLVLVGALIGAFTGTLITVTGVADIIVTLAMLFVLAGAALAVLGLFGVKYLLFDNAFAGPIKSGIMTPLDASTVLMVSPWVGLVGVGLASIAAYVTLRLYVRL